jgi:hypothetical protein
MASWAIDGEWFKNCNCDPGCPCDFNQAPTHGQCEGMVAMRIDKGHYGDVSLDGLKFAGTAWWPGRIDEGDGHIVWIVDEAADEEQRQALRTITSGEAGGTMFEILAAVCPHVQEPLSAPIEFEFDIDSANTLVSHPAASRTLTTASDAAARSALRSPQGARYEADRPTALESPTGQPNLHRPLGAVRRGLCSNGCEPLLARGRVLVLSDGRPRAR